MDNKPTFKELVEIGRKIAQKNYDKQKVKTIDNPQTDYKNKKKQFIDKYYSK